MKPLFVTLFSVFFSLMSVVQVAEAKRFGAAKSFGYNKQVAPKSYSSQTTKKTSTQQTDKTATSGTASTAANKSGAAKWLGPLAGIAAGGLLAAMLFGDGFENIQLLDILLIALLAFILFKVFSRRQTTLQPLTANASARYQNGGFDNVYQRQTPTQANDLQSQNSGSIIGADVVGNGPGCMAVEVSEAPAWFDAARFSVDAKQHFLSLQQAWDNVDLEMIESYCSAELYQDLAAELHAVQPGDNVTVVDTLDAEIASMAIEGDYFIVSMRFSGFIEEQPSAGAHAFNEIWHIRRLADDQGNWQIAGIQQANAGL